MSADPKIACCRLGSGVPAATALGTPWSVCVACSTLGVPQTSATSRAASTTRPTRIDQAGAAMAIADAPARQARAISAVPAESCTSPSASHAANQSPTAVGGHSHQRGLARKNP